MKITEYMGNKVCTMDVKIEGYKVKVEFMFSPNHPEILDCSIRIDGDPPLPLRAKIMEMAEKETETQFLALKEKAIK
ncbi:MULTISPECIES: hypothetical protein [Sutcliffiella]|uniref:hypothetical protein n=1 Tax=Sutcliffiella TaxID=2837511 RepID=UPI0022DE16B8|nr:MULTISPECIES: hypothetical protein [Sutcliffiella]MED4015042.1 hypothetical protein [Sutcliffiella cohnii]WBL17231.1 hypothetical protein O1A01_11600 [Sutcliffiella sp. NC1]